MICQDGYAYFTVCGLPNTNTTDGCIANGGPFLDPAVRTGLNQTNTIAVVMQGDNIMIYVNQQGGSSSTNTTYSHGKFGVVANPGWLLLVM